MQKFRNTVKIKHLGAFLSCSTHTNIYRPYMYAALLIVPYIYIYINTQTLRLCCTSDCSKCVYIYIYIYIYTHTHTHTQTLHVCCTSDCSIYIYTYIHTDPTFMLHFWLFQIYMYIYIYIYIYIHTHTHTQILHVCCTSDCSQTLTWFHSTQFFPLVKSEIPMTE